MLKASKVAVWRNGLRLPEDGLQHRKSHPATPSKVVFVVGAGIILLIDTSFGI